MLKGKKIAVFCSSSRNPEPAYRGVALALGAKIANQGCALVFGGTDLGLMSDVAASAADGGAPVYASIPEKIFEKHQAFARCTELHRARDLAGRKAKMNEWADAFVVLPGGFGTLDELSEILAERQLKLHQKPVVILNVNDYYNPFMLMTRRMIADGLAPENAFDFFKIAHSVEEAFDYLGQMLV